MTGLRGRASIAGSALMIIAGLTIPAATATPATAATTVTQGVDVASFQHPNNAPINWASVAAAGFKFAGIKVTEGNYYTNPYYAGDATHESDAQQAAAAGLYVMPYAFANPFDPAANGTATQQADYAASKIKSVTVPAQLMLPAVLDIEADPYAATDNTTQCYGLSQSAMVTWIGQFLAEVKTQTDMTPIIYTSASFWSTCTGNSTAFSGYPLWLASYDVSNPALPSGWNNYTFWQYTSGGTVNGISVGTDLDYLGPVLQVSQVGKQIGPVQMRTLTSLAGQADTYSSSSLPSGLQISSSGQVTGAPAKVGQYAVTVTPSTGAVPAAMTFTWDVHGTITVQSPGNQETFADIPRTLNISTSGPDQDAGFKPVFTATGLPTGVSISSSGVISGSPSAPGTFQVTVSASDALYGTGSTSFTWTVEPALHQVFRPEISQLIYSTSCPFTSSPTTACGVEPPAPGR